MKMTIAAKVTVNRFPQIAAALPRETSLIVRKAANDIKSHAQVLAPFDLGTLRNSITMNAAPGAQRATVSTNVEYAPYQEYGTRFMAPQPFMLPAAERVRPAFIAAMKQLEARLR